jgi:hypothetical protein
MAATAVLILLLLFLIRPGVSHLKSRIVASISAGVGRRVEIGSVHLRLLPRPGFDLENLVVYDDPSFGAEPMLRASDVTAGLRLTSLWRGRLEIARLELTEPSLNLVHDQSGHWNLERLLENSAHMPLAPTEKARSETRTGFPYLEATSARINFKNGAEKKPYALTNADFSLWQASENSWGVRLKAQPFRTDLNLNDMGRLEVSGTWQRAEKLRDTPLDFSIEWSRAQLGQFTKFFMDSDKGWRGAVLLDVKLSGTPSNLQVVSAASIQDFRRYDLTTGEALGLAAVCEAQYNSGDHSFHDLACHAPVGDGQIRLKGNVSLAGWHSYALTLTADKVPAVAALALLERAKKNLPEDLTAEGMVSGNLSVENSAESGSKFRLDGRGQIANLHISSVSNKTEIGPEVVPFVLTSGKESEEVAGRAARQRTNANLLPFDGEPRVEFGHFSLGTAHGTAPAVHGWLKRSGYAISVEGDSDIARLLRIARMFGVPALQTNADGLAQVDLQITGAWGGTEGTASTFTGPELTGTAKLRNVHFAVRGAEPVEIESADMQLSADQVRVGNLRTKTAGSSWSGSVTIPRGCGNPSACLVHFELSADQIALGRLRESVNPQPKQRPWYRVLQSVGPKGPSFFRAVRAFGHVSTNRLQVQNLAASHVSAMVNLDSGKLEISDLQADVLGGKHHGQWQADFTIKPAVSRGSGQLVGVSLNRLAELMNDGWITGVADASYEVKGSLSEWWQTAEGKITFDAKEAVFPHLSLAEDDTEPLRIARMSGEARLQAGKLEFKNVKANSPEGKLQLSGEASLKRDLSFKLTRTSPAGGTSYTITGALAEPKVVPFLNPETQARLKPESAKEPPGAPIVH